MTQRPARKIHLQHSLLESFPSVLPPAATTEGRVRRGNHPELCHLPYAGGDMGGVVARAVQWECGWQDSACGPREES